MLFRPWHPISVYTRMVTNSINRGGNLMIVRLVCGALVLCLAGAFAAAQKGRDDGEILAEPGYRPLVTVSSPELQAVLRDALSQVTSTIPEFKVLNLSATLIDL